jgi:hypothetical protein
MSNSSSSQAGALPGILAGTDLGDGLWLLPGQGNGLAAQTDDGIVMNDAGSWGASHTSAWTAGLVWCPSGSPTRTAIS